jgi:hypothetical protein
MKSRPFLGSPAKPCVCIIGLNRMLLCKLKHAVNKMLSRRDNMLVETGHPLDVPSRRDGMCRRKSTFRP